MHQSLLIMTTIIISFGTSWPIGHNSNQSLVLLNNDATVQAKLIFNMEATLKINIILTYLLPIYSEVLYMQYTAALRIQNSKIAVWNSIILPTLLYENESGKHKSRFYGVGMDYSKHLYDMRTWGQE